jgi:hypothetical protein
MIWKVLIPFLRPLVPVAVDYARARMERAHAVPAPPPPPASTDELAERLAEAELQIEALAAAATQNANELAMLQAELNARMKAARTWAIVLLAWNVVVTALAIVALLT